MTRTPIPRRRKKPRRVLGREILHGKAKEARRREIFERSGGRCEAIVMDDNLLKWHEGAVYRSPFIVPVRCNRPITWETFHWSHNKHGARKCDCMDCGIASCRECHEVGVHNPKPCPKKESA